MKTPLPNAIQNLIDRWFQAYGKMDKSDVEHFVRMGITEGQCQIYNERLREFEQVKEMKQEEQ